MPDMYTKKSKLAHSDLGLILASSELKLNSFGVTKRR